MKQYQPHTASFGSLAANLVAALVYVIVCMFGGPLFIILSIVLFFLEKNSNMVKFSVVQALLLSAFYAVLRGIVNLLGGGRGFSWYGFGFLRGLFSTATSLIWVLLSVALIILYLVVSIRCAYMAYHWQVWQLPLIGDIANGILNGFGKAAYDGDGPVPPQCLVTHGTPGPQANQPGAYNPQPPQPPQPGPDAPQQPQNGPYSPQPPQGQASGYAPQGQAPNGSQPVPYQPPQNSPYAPQPPAGAKPYSDPNEQLPPDMRDSKAPFDR